jgi:hypothetical protein
MAIEVGKKMGEVTADDIGREYRCPNFDAKIVAIRNEAAQAEIIRVHSVSYKQAPGHTFWFGRERISSGTYWLKTAPDPQECPNCGRMQLIPEDDYLCGECRGAR